MGAAGGSVWLRDPQREGWLVCQATSRQDLAQPLTNQRLAPGQGIAGQVVGNDESVIITDPRDDPHFVRAQFFGIGVIITRIDAVFNRHGRKTFGIQLTVDEVVLGWTLCLLLGLRLFSKSGPRPV